MTRTTPDPVLADAARLELERRVRAARPALQPVARPGRPGVMQLVVTAAVAVLILSVVVGLGQLRARWVGAPPPTTAPSATAGPTPSPTAVPPTSTPTSSPTSTGAARLVVPEGFQQRSDAQLRAWAATLPESPARTDVWIEQRIIVTHCMAGKGFLYDPERLYTHPVAVVPAGHEQAYEEALDGPASSGPYDWRTAGCDGLAVHETGQDGQH